MVANDEPKSSVKTALVLEIGGTTSRAAVIDAGSGMILARSSAPSHNFLASIVGCTADEAAETMWSISEQVLAGRSPDAVVVAYPGPCTPEGTIRAAPTLLGAATGSPIPLKEWCLTRWPNAQVAVVNDVTAAGYRYQRFPAEAVAGDDFCILTVGSGIGHTTFLDGRPREGVSGRGGEIGHLRVDVAADAPLCDCGMRGHLGALSSGRGAERHVRRLAAADPSGFASSYLSRTASSPEEIDGPAIATAFRSGDPWVCSAVAHTTRPLGAALAAIHLDVGVERFVIIGGFALGLGQGYRELLAEAASESCWNVGEEWDTMIELGYDDDDQGLHGGAVIARAMLARPDR